MKGIVFTELIGMIEATLGDEVADRVICGANTATDGAYTSVGTYDYQELISLVEQLARETGQLEAALVQSFGEYLFQRFLAMFPQFFDGVDSSISFLPTIEDRVHVEVRKLYPDAELPTFECNLENDGTLVLEYQSKRPFADLAEGLIQASIRHFQDDVSLVRHNLGDQDGTQARFELAPTSNQPIDSVASACQT
ncbi:MAG: heme NO-binding domain-containing protein [Pirellulaceae bacterium]